MSAPEDTEEFTPEEHARCHRYRRALFTLQLTDPMWVPNYTVFNKWPTGHRLWWLDEIEQQARDGKDTVGARLVAQVVMMRLEE